MVARATTGASVDEYRLREQLEMHEGRRNRPYRCTSGKTTIGVGRNLDDFGLTDEEVNFLLANDIKRVRLACKKYDWWQDLSDVRQRVVADMIFNLGELGFSRFHETIAALEVKDYAKAARQMLASRWASQVKGRAVRLARMMRTNEDFHS